MRGAARGLIVSLALALGAQVAAFPAFAAPYLRAIRALDGEQFLEDEPIWMCDPEAPDSVGELPYRLVGRQKDGETLSRRIQPFHSSQGRRWELGAWFQFEPQPELYPVSPFGHGGLRAGRYEIHGTGSDSARILATFHVIEPRASELAVRSAIARARRISQPGRDEFVRIGPSEGEVRAGQIYEAILRRYPRTAYRTAILSSQLSILFSQGDRQGVDRWIDEVFAQFHNSCFGEWALSLYVLHSPWDKDRARLRRLVGLYPSTRMARAATRYL